MFTELQFDGVLLYPVIEVIKNYRKSYKLKDRKIRYPNSSYIKSRY